MHGYLWQVSSSLIQHHSITIFKELSHPLSKSVNKLKIIRCESRGFIKININQFFSFHIMLIKSRWSIMITSVLNEVLFRENYQLRPLPSLRFRNYTLGKLKRAMTLNVLNTENDRKDILARSQSDHFSFFKCKLY